MREREQYVGGSASATQQFVVGDGKSSNCEHRPPVFMKS